MALRTGSPGRPGRHIRLLAAGAAVAVAASGCQLINPDPGAEVLEEFVNALDAGDLESASALTTDPEAARSALSGTFDSFEPTGVAAADILDAEVTGDSRTDEGPVELSIQWLPVGKPATDDAGSDDAVTDEPADADADIDATGTGAATVVEQGEEYRVEWSNTILDNRLTDGGHVRYQQVTGDDINVIDRTGQPLWSWREVTAVGLDATAAASVDPLVAALAGPVPSLDADGIREGLDEAEGSYRVVTLRDSDLGPVREQLEAIDGVSLTPTRQLIREDRSRTSPAITELPDVVDQQLAQNAGWSIGVFNPGEEETRIAGEEPSPGRDLVSTVQTDIQRAAGDAVDSSPSAASIVALQPSTGDVLAIAQNDAAHAQGPVATQGMFPPGSTFKVVTTAAALEAGVLGAEEIVPCPAEITVSGRTIPNFENIGRGEIPMSTAFAQSCNTTQAVIAERLDDDAIRDTAQRLGVAVEHRIPGLTVTPDTVPSLPPGPARIESAIGQGEILSNPFGMAVMMASLGNDGARVEPSVLVGHPAQAGIETEPLAPDTVATMRSYLEQAVRNGTATDAAGIPGLGGKTGTAEIADGDSHAWFAGITGDLAFAVLLEHGDSSTAAVQLSSQFLSGLPQPVPAVEPPER